MVSRDELPDGIHFPESYQNNPAQQDGFRDGFYDALEGKPARNWGVISEQQGAGVSDAYSFGYKEGLRYKVVGSEKFDE